MAAFLYVAVDADGRERKGVLEGDTARHVRQLLRDQALLPVSVSEVVGEQKQAAVEGATGRRAFAFKFQRGLSAADLSGRTAPAPRTAKQGSKVPAKYRDAATGDAWSGRGLQPKWLKAALAQGKTLADFAV